jgi:Ran GTPase-activating protein (RanGAP) involved in mRNA processing and transport
LKENEVLKEIILNWNQISSKGGIFLAEGIQENNSLVVLDLAFNRLGENILAGVGK